jgi:hypothetical protein
MIFLVNRGLSRGKIYRPAKATGQLRPFQKKRPEDPSGLL